MTSDANYERDIRWIEDLKDPELSADRVAEAAERDSWVVRGSAAHHNNASEETLRNLAKDQVGAVRANVAEVTESAELQSRLAGDLDPRVRHHLAHNRAVGAPLLFQLLEDEDPDVRLAAMATLLSRPGSIDPCTRDSFWTGKSPAEWADNEDWRLRWFGAIHPSTPPETLAGLAKDEKVSVRGGVAGNKSTPPESLTTPAADASPEVRGAVAANPATPPETLTLLAADADGTVRAAAVKNPKTPKAGRAAGGLLAD